MTTIFKKQGFLAASAIAAIAGVALSIPNSVSAANLATYDFEFKFADNSSGSGYITVDKDNRTGGFIAPAPDAYDYSYWSKDQWVDFSFAYLGTTYTKADTKNNPYFGAYDFPTSSSLYPYFGSYLVDISATLSDGKYFYGAYDSNNYNTYGHIDRIAASSFSLTERKAVPVPAFAFGIVAAGGWIASKQLRRQTKAVKQEVAV